MSRKLEANQCPRCGGGVPNDTQRGQYPGALSRYDNATYVCSKCGSEEGLSSVGLGSSVPFENWWVNRG